jgi:DNA-binding MarR family transcriptional regulator
MSGRLAKEIQQTRPFALLEEEAFLNVGRTFEALQQPVAELLKQYQLTPTQYNLLRILRGAGQEGVTCSQACERMITPDPDMTRLLDRMEARHLVERERSLEDRRIVVSRIRKEGLALVNEIDQPLHALLKRLLGHIGQKRLRELIETLELLREGPG